MQSYRKVDSLNENKHDVFQLRSVYINSNRREVIKCITDMRQTRL